MHISQCDIGVIAERGERPARLPPLPVRGDEGGGSQSAERESDRERPERRVPETRSDLARPKCEVRYGFTI